MQDIMLQTSCTVHTLKGSWKATIGEVNTDVGYFRLADCENKKN